MVSSLWNRLLFMDLVVFNKVESVALCFLSFDSFWLNMLIFLVDLNIQLLYEELKILVLLESEYYAGKIFYQTLLEFRNFLKALIQSDFVTKFHCWKNPNFFGNCFNDFECNSSCSSNYDHHCWNCWIMDFVAFFITTIENSLDCYNLKRDNYH